MNIIEAVKSGKRFRRKAWCGSMYKFFDEWSSLVSTDIASDDWEVEEPKVMITREQLFKAYWNTLHTVAYLDNHRRNDHIDAIAKELGL
jgi:hypothetical protein